MIDLYYWPTPNGHKITLFLEEANLAYKLIPINISQGDQFAPSFLDISPNNKMPAIVDHQPMDSQQPLALFESGAILIYLADKVKQFLASHGTIRYQTLAWLCWQIGGLGPMAGQAKHFLTVAPQSIDYAIGRYVKEVTRLYTVLNKQLTEKEYITGEYSIADMACYPWVALYEQHQQTLEDYPHLKRWLQTMQNREAVKRAYARGSTINK